MRIVIGIVVLILAVGTAALIGVGIAASPTMAKGIPSYATTEEITRQHANDLSVIVDAISVKDFTKLKDSVSRDVVAVFRGDKELLGRYRSSSKSFLLMNGAGSGTLVGREIIGGEAQVGRARTFDCVVITIHGPGIREDGYQVFFLDRQAGTVEQ